MANPTALTPNEKQWDICKIKTHNTHTILRYYIFTIPYFTLWICKISFSLSPSHVNTETKHTHPCCYKYFSKSSVLKLLPSGTNSLVLLQLFVLKGGKRDVFLEEIKENIVFHCVLT